MNNLRKLQLLFHRSDNEAAERQRRARLTSAMNLAAQATSIFTGLISIPLTLSYLDKERFGVWMGLSTLLSVVAFTDFGITIGAQDRISRALSQQRRSDAQRVFTTSLTFLIGIAFLLAIAGHFSASGIKWQSLYALKSTAAADEAASAARALAFVLSIGLVSGLIQRTFFALQEGYTAAAINVGSRVASLALLVAAVYARADLPMLIIAVTGTGSIAMITIGTPLLFVRHRWLVKLPDRRPLHLATLHDTLKIGVYGLLASIAFFIANNSIQLGISTKYGAEAVVDFSILYKLLTVPLLLLTNLLNPYWPAITDASGKGEVTWIIETYRRIRRITIAASVICASALILGGTWLIGTWTGQVGVQPSTSMLLGASVFMVCGFWSNLYSVLLNGLSKYRSQGTIGLVIALTFGALALLLPSAWPKESVVWTVTMGCVLRCLLLRTEVHMEMSRHRRIRNQNV